jgi:large subunit ribosomal protein L19
VNILMNQILKESKSQDMEKKPAVWSTDFRVGDAIEIDYVPQGGINGNDREKLRGVILGRHNRGMDTSIYVRDVVYGEPVERKIPLHNPMVKSLTVLERNFVHKGKKRVKRAKLFYLRERKQAEYKVTGVCKHS